MWFSLQSVTNKSHLINPCNSTTTLVSNGSDIDCDDTFLLAGANNSINGEFERSTGQLFFRYVTPVIFWIGVIGNILSLRVFVTKNMRKLSASIYLAALAISDLIALVFYVLIEWLKRGLPGDTLRPVASFIEENGMCQIILYFQYVSRFLSAWLVVCFTFERYIGVCHPLKRKDICDINTSRKIVMTVIVISMILCTFKPSLSGTQTVGTKQNRIPYCAARPEYQFVSFILDCVFGMTITFLPFCFITVLNAMIIRKLFIRNRRHRECKIITEESIIRLEFTIILIAISFCFIAFNTPYMIIWFKQFLLSMAQREYGFFENHSMLSFTRTIFYMNYCVNFFLYSVTGAYFRKELQMLFTYKSKPYQNYHRCSVHNSNSNTPQSWLWVNGEN